MSGKKGKSVLKTKFPRDAPGKIDLHGGTGGITAACPCGDFLEIYKEDVTFRIKTPESIDPDRTNPNAPFVAAVSDTVGSSSPAVARILLQGRDIVETAIFERQIDKAIIVQALHKCKESLVVCEKVSNRIASSVDKIIEEIQTSGVKLDSGGHALNPFPQVLDLDSDATAFLINAKRTIQAICHLPSIFLPLSGKDNNFDHLGKTLAKAVGPEAQITQFVQANAALVRYLIELRNWQEHPKEKRTTINNFTVLPNGSISVPMWHVSGDVPQPIREDMLAATKFLVQIAEAMLIYLVMDAVDKRFPFIIVEIDPAQFNPSLPIKYRLSIDLSKLEVNTKPSK